MVEDSQAQAAPGAVELKQAKAARESFVGAFVGITIGALALIALGCTFWAVAYQRHIKREKELWAEIAERAKAADKAADAAILDAAKKTGEAISRGASSAAALIRGASPGSAKIAPHSPVRSRTSPEEASPAGVEDIEKIEKTEKTEKTEKAEAEAVERAEVAKPAIDAGEKAEPVEAAETAAPVKNSASIEAAPVPEMVKPLEVAEPREAA